MKQQQITITGLVFTLEGRRIGRGSIITPAGQNIHQALRENILQLGRVRYEEDAPPLPRNRACCASFDGGGQYWLTLSPDRFLLREVPQLQEERHKA